MEKFYCESCRLLYDIAKKCEICGVIAERRINIIIHNQGPKKNRQED